MKTLLIVLALLITGTASADWVFVGEGQDATYYIDPDTIRRSGNLRKVWTLYDYKQRKLGDLSAKSRREFDCEQERYRLLSVSFHTEKMGRGAITNTESYASSSWNDIPPKTFDEHFLKAVCAR
jgi:hypothetical protein